MSEEALFESDDETINILNTRDASAPPIEGPPAFAARLFVQLGGREPAVSADVEIDLSTRFMAWLRDLSAIDREKVIAQIGDMLKGATHSIGWAFDASFPKVPAAAGGSREELAKVLEEAGDRLWPEGVTVPPEVEAAAESAWLSAGRLRAAHLHDGEEEGFVGLRCAVCSAPATCISGSIVRCDECCSHRAGGCEPTDEAREKADR